MRAGVLLCFSASLIACGIDERTELDTAGGSSGTGGLASGGFGGSGATGGIPSGGGGSGGTTPDSGTGGGAAGTPSGGTAGVPGGGGGGPVTSTVDYVATVAECVGASDPDPDVCFSAYAELHLDVSADFLSGATSLVYIRFDIDNQLAGAKSVSAELVLTNVNGADKSGEVHEVPTFNRPDLFVAAPTLGNLIGPDLGAVTTGQSTIWPLSSAPTQNQAFCVGLSTTTTNGIGYAVLPSGTPPVLRVTFTK